MILIKGYVRLTKRVPIFHWSFIGIGECTYNSILFIREKYLRSMTNKELFGNLLLFICLVIMLCRWLYFCWRKNFLKILINKMSKKIISLLMEDVINDYIIIKHRFSNNNFPMDFCKILSNTLPGFLRGKNLIKLDD